MSVCMYVCLCSSVTFLFLQTLSSRNLSHGNISQFKFRIRTDYFGLVWRQVLNKSQNSLHPVLHFFTTTPVYFASIRRSIVYLASLLSETAGGKKRAQKISFLCNLELATCPSLIRTGRTSVDFVPLLCFLFLGCISTYFWELFRAGHLECWLSAVAIPQKSTKPHKCLNEKSLEEGAG